MNTSNASGYLWEFKARFRRRVFGWRSQPAIQRIREAVSEIKNVSRRAPLLAAEGSVILPERLSPALEQVDSSSGAIGNAVNRAIAVLVTIIGGAVNPGSLARTPLGGARSGRHPLYRTARRLLG